MESQYPHLQKKWDRPLSGTARPRPAAWTRLYLHFVDDKTPSLFGRSEQTDEQYGDTLPAVIPSSFVYQGDCEAFLDHTIATGQRFDLVLSSPPYNIGKAYNSYRDRRALDEYLEWQRRIITKCVRCIPETGSLCWQTGNYVRDGQIIPLDMEMAPIFKDLGLQLRNRVIWAFGHGLHCKRRFSGRYETILWFTKSDRYKFNLDPVRVPSKYPGKKHFHGAKRGQLSCNPLGKNPSDVWETEEGGAIGDFWRIPHVGHNHCEKTPHPCQFPLGLVKRFIEALTDEGDAVFDPFLGAGTTAAAAAMLKRRYYGCELNPAFLAIARERIEAGATGNLRYRDPDKPIFQPPATKRSAASESSTLLLPLPG